MSSEKKSVGYFFEKDIYTKKTKTNCGKNDILGFYDIKPLKSEICFDTRAESERAIAAVRPFHRQVRRVCFMLACWVFLFVSVTFFCIIF